MASRGVKITVGIVGGTLALALLAVLALVGWGLFRPLLSGDYNHTRGDIRTVSDLNSIALEGMVTTVGTPVSAEQEGHLDNRITNTIGQIEVINESVDAAKESRAGTKDLVLRSKLSALGEAYTTLQDTFGLWQNQGYGGIGWALHQCRTPAPDVADPPQACTDAAAKLSATPQSPELAALAQAVTDYAESDRTAADTQQLDTAQEEFSAAVDQMWQRVVTTLGEVDQHLVDKGA